MRLRQESFDPPTVEGFKHELIRPRQLRFLGVGCGRWVMGCLMAFVSLFFLCGVSAVAYTNNPPEMVNVLVVGVDARPGQAVSLGRTDVVMILSIDPQREQISAFSIPRDTVITSPTYGRIPINTISRSAEVNQPGTGMEELEKAMETTFGIEVDYWVRFDFNGFIQVVDALGGIEIDVDKRIIDNTYPTEDYGTEQVIFEPGLQWMDGDRALKYARTRHADTDIHRAQRQQQVVEAVLHQIASISNIPRLPTVLTAIQSNTETNMDFNEAMRYAPAILLYGRNPRNLEFFVVDLDYLVLDTNGKITPNVDKLDGWLNDHLRQPATANS
jgi:LCP family protein required for cell wall assembly